MAWVAVAVGVAGAATSAYSANKASKAQGASADAATQAQLTASRESNALQKSIYDQNRADSSPWVNTGAGALNQLAWKMGITPTSTVNPNKSRDQIYAELQQSGNYDEIYGKRRDLVRTDYTRLNAEADRLFNEQKTNATNSVYQGDQADFGSLQQKFGMDQFQADPGYQFRMDEGNKGIERSAAARGGQLSGATMKALARFGQDTASNEYQNSYNRFNNDQTTQYNRLSGIAGTGQQQVNALGQAGQNYAGSVGNNTMNAANNVANNTIGAGNARAASYMATGNAVNNAIGTGVNTWQQQNYLNNMGSNNMTAYGTTPGSQQSNMLAAQW